MGLLGAECVTREFLGSNFALILLVFFVLFTHTLVSIFKVQETLIHLNLSQSLRCLSLNLLLHRLLLLKFTKLAPELGLSFSLPRLHLPLEGSLQLKIQIDLLLVGKLPLDVLDL